MRPDHVGQGDELDAGLGHFRDGGKRWRYHHAGCLEDLGPPMRALQQRIEGRGLAVLVRLAEENVIAPELARAGNIVSNQIFKPLLVFGIVGVFYFMICWPLSLYGSWLERRLAAPSR